jgi:hypothetical protein
MKSARLVVVSSCLLFGIGIANASAQQTSPTEGILHSSDIVPVTLSSDQDRDLQKWLKAMEAWQKYDAKWANRPVHNGWGGIAARKSPPEPPEWLDGFCAAAAAAGIVDFDDRAATACRLLRDPRAPMKAVPTPAQASRLNAEAPPKHSSFLSRVHLDGLWTTAQTTGRVYGLVGSHLSLVDVGRVQVFGPPGVMLLSVPDGTGSRRVMLAYTWGISVRLVDTRLFGEKDMTLFLNVSKVWVNAGGPETNVRGFDAIGFSLAPRKKR